MVMSTFASRRRLIRAGLTTLAIGHLPALRAQGSKAKFTLRYANNASIDHPINIRATEAAAKIKAQSNGEVEILIFPNNQLGGDTELISQLRQGAIDMLSMPSSILATVVPEAAITGVGFAFDGYEPLWNAMDGELGAFVREGIEKTGLRPMGKIWDNGFRQITTSTKPILSAEDFSDLKIRVPVSPLHVSLFRALGAAPVTMNYSELYTALQTKVVDGQDNALVLLPFAKFYEVQKYCSITNHMWDGFWQLMSRRTHRSLPTELSELVANTWDEAAVPQRADMLKLNTDARTLLEEKGLIFNQAEVSSVRGQLRKSGFYEEWKEKFGADGWATLEKYAGSLA